MTLNLKYATRVNKIFLKVKGGQGEPPRQFDGHFYSGDNSPKGVNDE
ncbi:MAG: hypothetical protein ACI9JU_002621 [Pseudohongiellaceae bacterium]|jgi:hypothetical protein